MTHIDWLFNHPAAIYALFVLFGAMTGWIDSYRQRTPRPPRWFSVVTGSLSGAIVATFLFVVGGLLKMLLVS